MKNYNRAVTCQNPTSGLKSHISQLKYRFQMLQTVLFEMKEIFVVFTPPPPNVFMENGKTVFLVDK